MKQKEILGKGHVPGSSCLHPGRTSPHLAITCPPALFFVPMHAPMPCIMRALSTQHAPTSLSSSTFTPAAHSLVSLLVSIYTCTHAPPTPSTTNSSSISLQHRIDSLQHLSIKHCSSSLVVVRHYCNLVSSHRPESKRWRNGRNTYRR